MKQVGKKPEAFKAKVFKALSDPARLEIVELLKEGGKYVSDIVKRTGVVQPAVSRHLKILKECGMVEESKVGNKRLYKVTDPRIFKVINSLDTNLMDSLKKHVLERMV
ncbi:MAG: metalloregulator ArsR/SmtB family transcription factor [Crenarchaeota archaeon]|nr:metalloregulator ArsR/SmtB family transcription factor [Thermoproteota archaeon]MDW8033346.1 metalloregulator ArsR/SmtB family transcription factor [Nitrososphaerota archaeon]